MTDRISICYIPVGRNSLYVESDHSKVYVRYHYGMMADSVLEVGYNSINGSLGCEKYEDCKAKMVEAALIKFNSLVFKPQSEVEVLQLLFSVAKAVDAAWNDWLGRNQDYAGC